MNEHQIKLLIDKYFEGLTSLDEEQTLRTYFRQNDIPEKWKMYQPIFRFYSDATHELNIPTADEVATINASVANRRQIWFRNIQWLSIAAAACFVLFVGKRLSLDTKKDFSTTSLAYIDGKKQTNIEVIQMEALKSLENLTEDYDNFDEIISSQIDALSAFFE